MMDAVNSVIQSQQGSLAMQIQTALMGKQLSAMEAQGKAVVEMLDAAVQLSKAVGRGETFDATA